MSDVVAKPGLTTRLRRAGVWLLPFAVLAMVRELLDVPDELFAMPANGVPPTRMEGVINLATGISLWFGTLAFLGRLVWDDSPGLSVLLVGLMAMQAPFATVLLLQALFS